MNLQFSLGLIASVVASVVVRCPGPRQACPTLAFELDDDSRYRSIGDEAEEYPTANKVEIGVVGMWAVKRDPDRHRALRWADSDVYPH